MCHSKKDILFLCQFFYPEYVSSATLPFDTAKALADVGFSVGALCGYPKEYSSDTTVPKKEIVENIDIRRVQYIQLKRSNFVGRLINYFSFTFAVLLRFFSFRKYRSIIVYSNPPIVPLLAVWAKKLFGCKLIFIAYDLYPEIAIKTGVTRENSLIVRFMRYVNKKVYLNADNVVALGTEMKEFITSNRVIDESKITVIPNWYEDCNTVCDKKKDDNRYAEKYKHKLVVSYFGNMGTCQDLETILGSIRILKDNTGIQFVFAGHGNKLDQLRETVKNENFKNVDIYDFLHGKAYEDALAISDCALVSLCDGLTGLCVPSKTYAYMMAATPIIAIMGDSDLVTDIRDAKCGFAIQNGESEKMACKIRLLMQNREKLEIMGNNSREVFLKKYEKQRCLKKYILLLVKILR